jgi:hypothetical protein
MDHKPRKNTYLPGELLKIILFSLTKERSEEGSMWLTNTKESSRGVFRCSYSQKKTSILVFPRWLECGDKQTTTIAVEALIVFANDSQEFNTILPELQKYAAIPIRVLVSNNDDQELVELTKQNKFVFHKQNKERPEDLRNLIDSLDEEEFTKISSAFNCFDTDHSGIIEQKEMREIAKFLGENPDTDEFREAMLALDKNNDGNISITEFVHWWKIGRQNTKALPKIYHLKENLNHIMTKNMNFHNFVKEILEIKLRENLFKSTQNITFIGPGAFKWRSQLDANVCFGGTERVKHAEKFLSNFTKNLSAAAKANWISLLFNNLNEKICSIQEASNALSSFQEKIVKWCETNNYEGFAVFIKNLLIFETSMTANSVILGIRFKLDIEDLVKLAFENFLFILSCLVIEKQSHEFSLTFRSNQDFYLNGLEGKTIGDFLEICELNIKNSGFRERIKCILTNMNEEAIRDVVSIVQFFFVPYNLNVRYSGNINEFVDETTKHFLSIPMTGIGRFLEFIVKNMSEKLFKSTNDISIAANVFDIFAHFKLFCYSFAN